MTGFRPHLRLIQAPPRPQRIEVRISAFDRRVPIGRSRAFRLAEPDIERLVNLALRLEARR